MTTHEICPNEVLIFDVIGPMAHFRKYYTNSSSLSYTVPPRTVIIGLIAGMLGFPSERYSESKNDIYYEKFTSNECFVTVSNKVKIRKIMQTVNYIRAININHVDGSKGGTQIPLEILLPAEGPEIIYRVFFSHKNENIYSTLKNRLKNNMFVYPPYLGLSEFLATIRYIGEGKVQRNTNEGIEITSICKFNGVELEFNDERLQYISEKMPTGFLNDRTPLEPSEYISEINGNCIKIKRFFLSTCYSVEYNDNNIQRKDNIIFM